MCCFRQGCSVAGTCAEQNSSLVQFLRLPPPLLATRILCLKVSLKLELPKRHLEFHRDLAGGQRHTEIFPLTYHEVTIEVAGLTPGSAVTLGLSCSP